MGVSRRAARWLLAALAAVLAVAGGYLLYQRSGEAREIDRLATELRLAPGARVADIGAGKGRVAFALARRVGDAGRIFATEIDPERLGQLREAIEREQIRNVEVIEAGAADTGLEAGCCDAAYLRDVYHHLSNPVSIDRDLHRAIRPGGRLVVIDFEPGWFLTRFYPVEGAPANRGGHGVPPEVAIEELRAAGFELDRRIDGWGSSTYALVFDRPEQ
jgi:ubiquinone/menaquinone biosynthesis C-methylase UbiE